MADLKEGDSFLGQPIYYRISLSCQFWGKFRRNKEKEPTWLTEMLPFKLRVFQPVFKLLLYTEYEEESRKVVVPVS